MPRSLVNLVDEIGLESRVNTLEGAASTVKNYIPNAVFNSNTPPVAGWSLFNTTIDSTTKIPTGSVVAGAAGFNTLATTATTPLSGLYSLLVSTPAGVTITTTGFGFISSAFTIDREDAAKVLSFSFAYEAILGTMNFSGTSANTWAVYIRDVSGGTWIQPAGVYNLVQSSGTGLCSGTFQTTATGTQYQIAVMMINTVSSAVSMKFDSFQLGPQKIAAGAAVSDWQSYTPTITNFGPAGSVAVEAYYRRVGGNLEVNIDFTQTANFSSSTGLINVNLIGGLGLNIDTTKLAENGPTEDNYGHVSGTVYGVGYSGGQTYVGRMDMTAASKTSVTLYGDSGSLSWNTTSSSPATWAVSTLNSIRIHASVPIVGWSSNTVLSQDTDTRVVDFRAYTTAARTVNNSAPTIIFENVDKDSHGAYNASTGVYTVPVSGDYVVSGQMRIGSLTMTAGAFFGFSAAVDDVYTVRHHYTAFRAVTASSAGNYAEGSGSVLLPNLRAGQTIRVKGWGDNATATFTDGANTFCIQRISGPATIAASETVAFSANTSTTSVANGSLDTMKVIIMSSVAVDTHAAYNVSTGAYTVPVSGKYLISGNGALGATLVHFRFGFGIDTTSNFAAVGQTYAETAGVIEAGTFSSIVSLNAGQVIRFGASHGSASPVSMLNDGRFNFVSIMRIGS